MLTKNEIVIMSDPALNSSTGLASIDYVKEPIKPIKIFKMGNTQIAQENKLRRMSPKAL